MSDDVAPLFGDSRDARDLGDLLALYRAGQLKPRLAQEEPLRRTRIHNSQVVCLVDYFRASSSGLNGNVGSVRAIVMQHRPHSAVRDVIVTGGYFTDDGPVPLFALKVRGQRIEIPFTASAEEMAELCGYTDNKVTVTLGSRLKPDRDPSETGAWTPLLRWRFEAAVENANDLPQDAEESWGTTYQVSIREDYWVGSSHEITVWDAIPALTDNRPHVTRSHDELIWQNNRWEIQAINPPVDGDVLVWSWYGGVWHPWALEPLPDINSEDLAHVRLLSDGTWMLLHGNYLRDGNWVVNETLGEHPDEGTQLRLYWRNGGWRQLTNPYLYIFGISQLNYGTNSRGELEDATWPLHATGLICVVSWTGSAWVIVEREHRQRIVSILDDSVQPDPGY